MFYTLSFGFRLNFLCAKVELFNNVFKSNKLENVKELDEFRNNKIVPANTDKNKDEILKAHFKYKYYKILSSLQHIIDNPIE